MSVVIRIPTMLRPRTGGEARVEVEGTSISQVIDALVAAHPGIGEVLRERDGTLKRFVNVFLGEENINYLEGLDTPVPDGAEIVILPAAAGG